MGLWSAFCVALTITTVPLASSILLGDQSKLFALITKLWKAARPCLTERWEELPLFQLQVEPHFCQHFSVSFVSGNCWCFLCGPLHRALDRLAESLERIRQLSGKMKTKATHMRDRQQELSQVQRDTEPKVARAIAHAKELQEQVSLGVNYILFVYVIAKSTSTLSSSFLAPISVHVVLFYSVS